MRARTDALARKIHYIRYMLIGLLPPGTRGTCRMMWEMSLKHRRYWALLRTNQASSSDAVRNARAQGFHVYHPMYRERRVRGVRRIRALFPSYLLVNICMRDPWQALHSTRGVTRLFMSGSVPSRVPDHHIEYFQGLENSLGYIELEEHECPRFNRDQSVVGVSGLFEAKFGTYQGLAGSRSDRIRVLFDILGKPSVFELDAQAVKAA